MTSRGYGVVVPELLGYGETDAPKDVESYAFHFMCQHIALILDAEHVDKVVVLGHDWGAPFGHRFAQYFPNRVTALIGCVSSFYINPLSLNLNIKRNTVQFLHTIRPHRRFLTSMLLWSS